MKQAILIAMVLGLVACGRAERFQSIPKTQPTSASVSRNTPVAFGPISQACLASDRRSSSRALCGCIQFAANETLSSSQQSRAVTFYNSPQAAQSTRQSNRGGDERFWEAYRSYEDRAKALCR